MKSATNAGFEPGQEFLKYTAISNFIIISGLQNERTSKFGPPNIYPMNKTSISLLPMANAFFSKTALLLKNYSGIVLFDPVYLLTCWIYVYDMENRDIYSGGFLCFVNSVSSVE